MSMPDDPVFPLYNVVFSYDGGNGTSEETTRTMRPWLYKDDPGSYEVCKQAVTTWPTVSWPGAARPRRLLAIEIERKPDVPWALGWFSHETYRIGRSDDELRASFERWVRRWEYLQNQPTVPCLMGAQDRWRWKPWCTCRNCTQNDRALIGH
jgi:hypothetical protein